MRKKHEKQTVDDSEPSVINFGKRTVSNQNFSKMVALPKMALANCSCDGREVKAVDVQLVQKGDEKFIKLIPVCNDKKQKNKKGGKKNE